MTLLDDLRATQRPSVTGELPGPRSAALLARQERRESNGRVYGRHFPIAVDDAEGSFLRDVDGNVFIDFLTGAGVLSLGHNHPELIAVAAERGPGSSPVTDGRWVARRSSSRVMQCPPLAFSWHRALLHGVTAHSAVVIHGFIWRSRRTGACPPTRVRSLSGARLPVTGRDHGPTT